MLMYPLSTTTKNKCLRRTLDKWAFCDFFGFTIRARHCKIERKHMCFSYVIVTYYNTPCILLSWGKSGIPLFLSKLRCSLLS